MNSTINALFHFFEMNSLETAKSYSGTHLELSGLDVIVLQDF